MSDCRELVEFILAGVCVSVVPDCFLGPHDFIDKIFYYNLNSIIRLVAFTGRTYTYK